MNDGEIKHGIHKFIQKIYGVHDFHCVCFGYYCSGVNSEIFNSYNFVTFFNRFFGE